jgi:uncharacterized protein YeaO (DUF488 family)
MVQEDIIKLFIKRVYEPAASDDGLRVLIDRLWPRGLDKEKAAVDLWLKEIAPSPELRKWFGHDPEKWVEFQRRYRAELNERGKEIDLLRERGGKGRATLLYGAKDEQHNHAIVLRDFLAKS